MGEWMFWIGVGLMAATGILAVAFAIKKPRDPSGTKGASGKGGGARRRQRSQTPGAEVTELLSDETVLLDDTEEREDKAAAMSETVLLQDAAEREQDPNMTELL